MNILRFAKIPDEPAMAPGGLVSVEQNSTSSSGSSSGSSSDSDDSQDERERKLSLLQEQVIKCLKYCDHTAYLVIYYYPAETKNAKVCETYLSRFNPV